MNRSALIAVTALMAMAGVAAAAAKAGNGARHGKRGGRDQRPLGSGGYVGTNGDLLAGMGFEHVYFAGSAGDLAHPESLGALRAATDLPALPYPGILVQSCKAIAPPSPEVPAGVPAVLCDLPDNAGSPPNPDYLCAGEEGTDLKQAHGRTVVIVPGHWDQDGAYLADGLTVACGWSQDRADDFRGAVAKCASATGKPSDGWNLRTTPRQFQSCVRAVLGDVCKHNSHRRRPGDRMDLRDANVGKDPFNCKEAANGQPGGQPQPIAFEAVWGPDGVLCLSSQFAAVLADAVQKGDPLVRCVNAGMTAVRDDWAGGLPICANGADDLLSAGGRDNVISRHSRFQYQPVSWPTHGLWRAASFEHDPYCDPTGKKKDTAAAHESRKAPPR